MALPFAETWTGSNGAAWPADWTTTGSAGVTVDIQSNQGRTRTGAVGAYADYCRGLLTDQAVADFDLTVDVVVGAQAEKYPNIGFRTDRAWNASEFSWPANGYGVELGISATAGTSFWAIDRVDADTRTSLSGQITYTMTTGDTLHVNIRCAGDVVQFRLWKNSESKPAAPTYSFNDATHNTRTGHGLAIQGGNSATNIDVSYDNLSIVAVAPLTPGVFVQQLGTAVSNSNGTTLAISFTGTTKPAVGDLVCFYAARDNVLNDPGTGDSFSDGEGNTYTSVVLAQPAGTSTAAAGIVGVMFYTVVTSTWTGTNTLTWTLPSRVGKVMRADHFQGPFTGLRGTADTAGATAGTVTVLTTDPLSGDLVCAMSAIEHSTASTVTADSDTTNGSWSTQSTQLASGGTTLAAVKVVSQFKLVTATGNQSYATSNSTTASVDTVGIVATFIPSYPLRPRQPSAPRGAATNSNFY